MPIMKIRDKCKEKRWLNAKEVKVNKNAGEKDEK